MVLPALGMLGLGGMSAAGAGATLGGLNFALGAGQAALGHMGQQQQYESDLAYQQATSEFATFQAGLNARLNDANKQYEYWGQTVNYNQELAYTNNLRNFETLQAIRQAEVVRDTRAAASAAFINDSEAINARYAESEMASAVAQKQYSWRALQARSSMRARGQEGNTPDRLVNDYARQEGDYMALQEINSSLASNQLKRAQTAQVAQFLSRWNSQDFYQERTYMDPIAPFPPLPTLITPPPPTRTGAGPSGAGLAMGLLGAGIDAYGVAVNTTAKLKALETPSTKTGAGTRRAFGSGLDLSSLLD
jgi:hypothetical protein